MPLTFLINNVDVYPNAAVPEKRSFSWTERLGSRNTGAVRLIQERELPRPRHGQSIVVIKGASYFDEILNDNPLGYWRLDEVSGTVAYDRSGHGLNGTYSGLATKRQTRLVKDSLSSVDFIEGLGRVLVGNIPAYSTSADFTIEAVIRPTRDYVGGSFYDVFSNETLNASGLKLAIEVHATSGQSRLVARTNQAGANVVVQSAYLPELIKDKISHVMWTYAGGMTRLYVDGDLVAGPTAQTAPVMATIEAAIAGHSGGTGFDGRIDEVSFYDSALSDARVLSHYEATLQPGRVFAGRLRQPTRSMRGLTHIAYDCGLIDFSEALDRRMVIAVYENKTLKEIVEDIVTNFLNGEGLLTIGVETGPTIERIVFNYKSALWCFNELSRRTGYAHWVDYTNVIHFRARSSYSAPFTVSAANSESFSITESVENYRNVQYLRAGIDLTDPRTEDFNGDGTQRTFSVGFPIGKVPTVTENRGGGGFGAAMTIGIKGVETGKDWYWSKGDNSIVQDNAGVVLAIGDVVRVLYQGQFPITVAESDDDEIADRAAIEGTSGRYEHIEDDRSIDTSDVAFAKVAALLTKYGMIADVVNFTTKEDGLRAGQLCAVLHTSLGVATAFLIESVVGSVENPDIFKYTVRAVGGNDFGAWQEFFQKLMQLSDTETDIAEVLQMLQTRSESTASNDNPSYVSAAPETRIGFAAIGFGEIV